jgi:hypothetical protein
VPNPYVKLVRRDWAQETQYHKPEIRREQARTAPQTARFVEPKPILWDEFDWLPGITPDADRQKVFLRGEPVAGALKARAGADGFVVVVGQCGQHETLNGPVELVRAVCE